MIKYYVYIKYDKILCINKKYAIAILIAESKRIMQARFNWLNSWLYFSCYMSS